jgi:hypothetical protein
MLTTPSAIWSSLLRPHVRSTLVATLLLAVVGAAGFAGYQQLFSSFASYDDEGYVLISLQSFLQGRPLYDATYSQYGPAYFTWHGLLHAVTGLPITSDVARLKTLLVWLSTAVLCAAYIFRMTGSRGIALVALLAVFFHLDRLGLEPAHPQSTCLLTIAATFFFSTFVRGRPAGQPGGAFFDGQSAVRRTRSASEWVWGGRGGLTRSRVVPGWAASKCSTASTAGGAEPAVAAARQHGWIIGMAIMAGTAAMCKLNVGGPLAAATMIALLASVPPRRFARGAAIAIGVAGALLPWAIARHHAFSLDGMQLPIVVAVGLAVTLWIALRLPPGDQIKTSGVYAYVLGLGLTCGLYAGVALGHGTTPRGLVHGLVLQHAGFVDDFYSRPPIYPLAIPCAVLAMGIAFQTMRGRFDLARVGYLGTAVLAVGIGLRHLTDSFTPLVHGADDRGHASLLLSCLTPLVVLVLLPGMKSGQSDSPPLVHRRFARLLLCTTSVLLPVVVYPIPGTQVAMGSLGLLLAVLIVVSDCRQRESLLGGGETLFWRGVLVTLLACSLLAVVSRDLWLWQRREQLSPLQLAGSERLRLPASDVQRERWTVAHLQQHADTFVCFPNGHNSLYLWSQIAPPTGWNATFWQGLLSDQQQQQVIEALAHCPRACVVVDRSDPAPFQAPLARFIQHHFEVVWKNGSVEIWMPAPAAEAERELLADH